MLQAPHCPTWVPLLRQSPPPLAIDFFQWNHDAPSRHRQKGDVY